MTNDMMGLRSLLEKTPDADLLREMIQEELQGEMGQRFSRNLRAVIRREIAAAIDERPSFEPIVTTTSLSGSRSTLKRRP